MASVTREEGTQEVICFEDTGKELQEAPPTSTLPSVPEEGKQLKATSTEDTTNNLGQPTTNKGDGNSAGFRILLWILVGVFVSCLPVLLGICFDWLSGYNLSVYISDYIVDFLLIVVAVAANAFNASMESRKSPLRTACVVITSATFILGIAFYSFLFRKTGSQIWDWANVLGLGCLIALLVNAVIGIIMELTSKGQ